MSQCQDGRSLLGLLVGQRAGRCLLRCASTAWPAIMLSTQNAEIPSVLGNTLKARSRRSVAIHELHHAFDKRLVATTIVPNWHLCDFTNYVDAPTYILLFWFQLGRRAHNEMRKMWVWYPRISSGFGELLLAWLWDVCVIRWVWDVIYLNLYKYYVQHQRSVRQGQKQNRSIVRLDFFNLTNNATSQ